MIDILNKEECTGCSACEQTCPKEAIKMVADFEGFSYPIVDDTACIECGLCVRICPMRTEHKSNISSLVYAVANRNVEIVKQSSSAGFFTLLASKVIKEGGVVFGARMTSDFTSVIHDYTENINELDKFRGSKYVQSNLGLVYKKVKQFLNNGRLVLFTGTPCQVSGLQSFLRKKYDNLITCDFICHGVPSPKVWKDYIQTFGKVKSVSFRNKKYGWRDFSLCIETDRKVLVEPISKNIYLKAFNSNIMLRPSCYNCKFRLGRSNSDITLGDFWGIEHIGLNIPDKNEGVSVVVFNNNKIFDYCSNFAVDKERVSYETIIFYNKSIATLTLKPSMRNVFFKEYSSKKCVSFLRKATRESFIRKVYRFLKEKI